MFYTMGSNWSILVSQTKDLIPPFIGNYNEWGSEVQRMEVPSSRGVTGLSISSLGHEDKVSASGQTSFAFIIHK